jgi:mono/diheme cytochrome c family protein
VKRALITLVTAVAAAAIAAGCRGETSAEPPIHLIGDMDWQPKYQANQASPLFEDGRAMRPLVEGTVAQGQLREDDAMYRGKTGDAYVATVPVPVDEALLQRGQDRFNIYCTPCHDKSGSGHGMIVKRGYPIPLDLASDRVRGLPDGQIFDVITNGVRNMPSYRKQIPVEDRWAIVTWVRVIGRSQHATIEDVPPEQRDRIDAESGTP